MRRRSALAVAAGVALYAAGSYAVYHRLPLVDHSRLPFDRPGANLQGSTQQVWFMEWARYCVLHLRNCFVTRRLAYPSGFNVLDNTSFLLLAVPLIPLTAAVGPVASWVVLLHLALIASATSAFLVLRALVGHTWAAFAGGAVYGFSPYVMGQAAANVHLTFLALPPVLCYLSFRLMTGSGHPVRTGAALGALGAAQFFVSSELLASSTLLIALLVAGAFAIRLLRRAPIAQVTRPLAGFGVALLVGGAVLAYPVWFALRGPRHITGPAQLLATLDAGHTDLLSPLAPARLQFLDPLHLAAGNWPHAPGNAGYLGLPLVLVMLAVAVRYRRSPLVAAAAALAVLAFLLSLGPRLGVDAHRTQVPLPFAVLAHLPVLESLAPARLSPFLDLAAATLLAVGLAALARRGRAGLATALVVALVALLPLVPDPHIGSAPDGVPRVFADGGVRHLVPTGAVVLSYPYPYFTRDRAMAWQAVDGLRFSLVGGFALFPGPDGHGLLFPSRPQRSPTVRFLVRSWPLSGPARPAAPSPALAGAVRSFCRRYRVTTVVVQLAGPRPDSVVAVFSRALGPPVRLRGLDIWPGVARRVRV